MNAELVYWMAKRNISNGQLAEKVHVSKTYISHLRTGQRKGPLKTWEKIADVLGVPVSALINKEREDEGGS